MSPLLNKRWTRIAELTFLWPFLQMLLFYSRFGQLPPIVMIYSAYFLPIGFLSGLFLFWVLDKLTSKTQKAVVVFCYALTVPLSIMTSLLGGLALPPLIGANIFGLVPLLIGSSFGYVLARYVVAKLQKKPASHVVPKAKV